MSEKKSTTLTSLAEQNYRPLVFLLSGLFLFGSGMFLAKAWQFRNPPPVRYETDAPVKEPLPSGEDLIKVDVSGAVKEPRVCELVKGSRVEDALKQSGGLSDEADREWVSKNLNLAAKLSDGEKLYIPKRGEVVGAAVSGSLAELGQSSAVGSSVVESKISGRVNINTASRSELESLPGIGPVKAQAIIAYRSNNPFDSIEEVMEVKGIGAGIFEKIKDRIVVR